MAAVVAASGAVFLHSGAADPLVTAAAERVAGLTGGPAQTAGPGASPERTERVSWSWDLGAPTWSANRPQPSQLRPKISIDPRNPARPSRPSEPWEPAGTPRDDGRPFWYGMYAVNPRVELEPRRDCPQYHGPTGSVPVRATATGPGRATLTWWDTGDPNTRLYQVDAFKRTGGDAVTSTTYPVAKPRTCRQVTVTVTGLDSGERYEFWLETVDDDPIDKGGTVRLARGRTEPVTIR
jgi:hypothetical protein